MSQHTGIPPNKPNNPYPISDNPSLTTVGIIRDTWDEYMQDFLDLHPGFSIERYTADGRPMNGVLHTIWNEIRQVHEHIMGWHPPNTKVARYREELRDIVRRAGDVKNAVCMGLGRITQRGNSELKHEFVQQCGVFFAMCQMIEEKQGMPLNSLPKIFQDPDFQIEERYVLDTIGRQTIVWPPEANDSMTEHTFVYAPHFPMDVILDTILRPGSQPEILLCGTFGAELNASGSPLAKHYIEQVYLTGNTALDPRTIWMYDLLSRFLQSHHVFEFDGIYSHEKKLKKVLRHAFFGASIYVRKSGEAGL